MKILLSIFVLINTAFAVPNTSMICVDTQYGAGHLKLIIKHLDGFFSPPDQKPMVKGDFWIKGEHYMGIMEGAAFLPDWGDLAGWYRSTPSTLDISLCEWKVCRVRKVRLKVHTQDQLKGDGDIKFILKKTMQGKEIFDRKLNCEFRVL